jgi:hypothetical protein
LAQALSNREDEIAHRNVVRHRRRADRSEKDRVKRAQLIERVDRHHASGAQVVIASPWEVREFALKVMCGGHRVNHQPRRGNDFLSDAITSNDGNSVSRH